MLTNLLSTRRHFAILCDFLVLRQKHLELANQYKWIKAELHVDFSKTRQACESLMREAVVRDQPLYEVEARIFFVRWSILGRSGQFSSLKHAFLYISR